MSNYVIVPVVNIFTREIINKIPSLAGKKTKEIANHFGSELLSLNGKKIILKVLIRDLDDFYVENARRDIEFLPENITESCDFGDYVISKAIPGIDAIEADDFIIAAVIVTTDYCGDWYLRDINTPLVAVLCTAESRRSYIQPVSAKSLIEYGEMKDVDPSSRY